MKRVILMAVVMAFAVAAQAGDTKPAAKDTPQADSSCCSKPKTEQTSLEQPKAEVKAEASCCGCCSKTMAKKSAKQVVLTPKGAELARR